MSRNTPNIQEAISACDSPPWVPTARITATGPVAAKINPIKPLAAYDVPKSVRRVRGPGSGRENGSISGSRAAARLIATSASTPLD